MAYLIDSDVMSSFLDGQTDALVLVDGLIPAGISISTVTYMEAFQGVLQNIDPKAGVQRFEQGILQIDILPFDESVARRCAHLRHQLALEGKRVRSRALDLMIAATALEHGLTLVTRNRADYQDIPGLTLA
jgi:predicted nucleic acid-binding protein